MAARELTSRESATLACPDQNSRTRAATRCDCCAAAPWRRDGGRGPSGGVVSGRFVWEELRVM
eukprot:3693942-Prymnesium_polylepis.1